MQKIATYNVFRDDDGNIQVYDYFNVHPPKEIETAIVGWYNKQKERNIARLEMNRYKEE